MTAEIHPLRGRPGDGQTPFERFCDLIERDGEVMMAAGAREMAERQKLAARIVRTMQAVIQELRSTCPSCRKWR